MQQDEPMENHPTANVTTSILRPMVRYIDLVSCWTIVPILLKPDAIEGEHTQVTGPAAADFAAYLAAALDSFSLPDSEPLAASSLKGALRARDHASAEMAAIPWYTDRIRDVTGCQERLAAQHAKWSAALLVDIASVIQLGCKALGFEVIATQDIRMTIEDYMMLYGDSPQPDMHDRMQRFMVGQRGRLMLVCGQQENSALQMLKTYLRYVLRYPTGGYSIENWLHVTNPDAGNYPELLRLFTVQRC